MSIGRFIRYDDDGNRIRGASEDPIDPEPEPAPDPESDTETDTESDTETDTESESEEIAPRVSKSSNKATLLAAAQAENVEGAEDMTREQLLQALGFD